MAGRSFVTADKITTEFPYNSNLCQPSVRKTEDTMAGVGLGGQDTGQTIYELRDVEHREKNTKTQGPLEKMVKENGKQSFRTTKKHENPRKPEKNQSHCTYNTSGDHSQNTGDLAFKLTANGLIETEVPMMHLHHQCFILESIKHRKNENHEKHRWSGVHSILDSC